MKSIYCGSHKREEEKTVEPYFRLQRLTRILYPPILYLGIMYLVQVIIYIYCTFFYAKELDERVTVSDTYTFVEKVQQLIMEHAGLVTMISASIGAIVFIYIYQKDRKVVFGQQKLSSVVKITVSDFKLYHTGMMILAAIFANAGLSRLFSYLPNTITGHYQKTSAALLGGNFFLQALCVALIVPVTEELVYRGLVCERMRVAFGEWIAIISQALIFGFFHFDLLQGLYAAMIGMFLGYIYVKYDNILYCILIHGVANMTALIMSANIVSEWISSHGIVNGIVMAAELVLGIIFVKINIFANDEK